MPHHRPCWSAWHIPPQKMLGRETCPHKRELKEPGGRPQGIAPTIPRIGLASPYIVGAIPCGRPGPYVHAYGDPPLVAALVISFTTRRGWLGQDRWRSCLLITTRSGRGSIAGSNRCV